MNKFIKSPCTKECKNRTTTCRKNCKKFKEYEVKYRELMIVEDFASNYKDITGRPKKLRKTKQI